MAVISLKNVKMVRLPIFISYNAFVFAGFSILWIWQYHTNPSLSDKIDRLVVPWMWLAGFFAASFLAAKRRCFKATLLSLSCAVAFSLFLFLFVQIVLVPIFDPWF